MRVRKGERVGGEEGKRKRRGEIDGVDKGEENEGGEEADMRRARQRPRRETGVCVTWAGVGAGIG